ncbi:hypothetical protein [Streptomyces boncukensis]|uniref:Integral membrane protein n=1 Tax=Streptomyces boncukensis TaxID=2711219 RepID=A0A6G4WZX3_9ACTN|nr:hypothetical protein [Streptomyces boncukensis]NGO70157.1 hypothetical protein [Streptomyces boncukensis]
MTDSTAHPPHPGAGTLRDYARGRLPSPVRETVEPHLDGCSHCRVQLAALVDHAPLDAVWRRLDLAIDAPVPGWLERQLLALRIPDHVARLMAATPALRASWLCGTVLTLVLAVLTARLAEPADTPVVYLTVAPLLPLTGVATSFGRRWDPAHEMGLVAAVCSFRLVLLRAAVVLGSCVLLTAVTSLALPRLGPVAFAWLLPSVVVTALSVLLLTRLAAPIAAVVAGSGWLAGVALTEHSEALFSAGGQSALAGLLAATVGALLLRRADFDTEKGIHP